LVVKARMSGPEISIISMISMNGRGAIPGARGSRTGRGVSVPSPGFSRVRGRHRTNLGD
jgi:hypothetical protein